jgi:orotidine-5'-phosphate decarboxylase
VILDAKFNDVGHSAVSYARAAFEVWGCDAVTVNPYLGLDGVEPFLSYEDRGVFVLARTSNPRARDLQDLRVDGEPLYLAVARQVQRWNRRKNCGLVVGATFPQEMERLRRAVPELPFLMPGIGVQGGDLEAAILHGTTARGLGPIVAVSRSIVYASSTDDFAQEARSAAEELRREVDRIGRCRK